MSECLSHCMSATLNTSQQRLTLLLDVLCVMLPVCHLKIRAHLCLQTAIHVCYGMDSSPNCLPVGLQAPHCNMFLISAESFVCSCCVLLCLSESVVLTLCFYIHVCLICVNFLGAKKG